MNKLLEGYLPMVDFLADCLGEHTEVVLHDLTDLEHSIVKIRNGHISGRREGDPCTDFVLRVLQKTPQDTQYDAGYTSTDRNGNPIKSGSFYIRSNNKKIIGMVCINIEIKFYLQARAYFDSFFDGDSLDTCQDVSKHSSENFATSISEMVDTVLARTISKCGCEAQFLSYEGKEQLIEKLNDEGIFMLKGSIGKTAVALGISEPSVYRYLSRLKKM